MHSTYLRTLFMGRASLREHWAPLFAKVAELSTSQSD